MSPLRWPLLALRLASALALDVLAPTSCAACDAPVRPRAIFCVVCARTVVRGPTVAAAEGAPVAFARFGGAVAIAIRRFKFENRPDLARPLGDLLRHAVRAAGLRADVVVPVPLHPRRLVERGYNQAALLSGAVGAELGAPVVARALERLRNTAQQARLDRQARLANLDRAFRVRQAPRVRAKRVVFIDDVATTGTTLGACRAALLEAGAGSVVCLVVARALGDPDPSLEAPLSDGAASAPTLALE